MKRFVIALSCFVLVTFGSYSQENVAETNNSQPLKKVMDAFPSSISSKSNPQTLEFCPDNTCDGFEASRDVSRVELEEFAYLYIYFFSDYYVLKDWRDKPDVRAEANRILANPKYEKCKGNQEMDAARCILRYLARDGRIKLLFIRYDEKRRNVVREALSKHLTPAPVEK